jgi:endo-1,4-beta-D-glucanase Y
MQIKTLLLLATAGLVSAQKFFDENGAYYGPDCDNPNHSGAYYTGDYTSPFKTYLGKTDAEIQGKLDQLWNHYFKGDNNSKVFYDRGNEGYILDVNNNDVRSEGMSYGMMIAVQTNHKEEFDKLWNWAKNHMWHKGGGWDGYFAWQRNTSGNGGDDNCAPDGEMYFMMSLLFAANRWNNKQYMDDAQYIIKRMWDNPQHKLFNQQNNIITFQPQGTGNNFSDPSYDLPAFVDLISRWSTTNQNRWKSAAQATRDHLYKSSNTRSGLFSDYNNFDGTPHSESYNQNASKYMYDAMRCAMNFGMDYYLFGSDAKRETEMAKRIIDFFEKDGYKHARFNWDGSGASEQYTQGETGANAVACFALMGTQGYESIIKKNLQMAWDVKPMTGQYR